MQRWAIGILDIQQHYDEALRCAREFTEFVKPILDDRRVNPGDDLLSKLATSEVEGERLDDEEIMAFLKLLFPAGADTTYLNLGSTLYALLTNREQLEHVREDPAERCRLAGEEGLRWYPSVPLLPRRNPNDVVWHDIAIPADTPLIFGLLGANRDPPSSPTLTDTTSNAGPCKRSPSARGSTSASEHTWREPRSIPRYASSSSAYRSCG